MVPPFGVGFAPLMGLFAAGSLFGCGEAGPPTRLVVITLDRPARMRSFRSEIADPYLAEVRRVDEAVGRVVGEIERLGRESTLVARTAPAASGRVGLGRNPR